VTAVVAASLLSPWLLAPLSVVAYLAQPLPRRLRGWAPVGLAIVPAIWVASCAADLGVTPAGSTAEMAVGWGAGMAAVGLLRRVDTTVRRRLRLLDPAAYGIPPGLLLGRARAGWVAAPQQIGALVIGPPRSGKTTGVVIPNVLQWQGPVVSTSTRREVLDVCAGVRGRRGEVWCCDPMQRERLLPPGVQRLDWSPLRGCERWDTACARARALVATAGHGTEDVDHWRSRGAQLLAALLHAASIGDLRMSRVVDWVHAGRVDPAEHLVSSQARAGSHAQAVLGGIARTPERERGSIWSAIAGALAPFDVTDVLDSADAGDRCPFDADAFLQGQSALFIVAPADLSVSLAPLVVGLVEEIRVAALRRSDADGGVAQPLLLALDEIANICPLPNLPQIASEGGGRNIVLLIALQDLSQAARRWGRDVAAGLLSVVGAKVILPGVADIETLERIEGLAGKHWVPQVTRTDVQGPRWTVDWSVSKHHGLVEQPRFPAAAIRQLQPGSALVLVGQRSPDIVKLAVCQRTEPFSSWLRLHGA